MEMKRVIRELLTAIVLFPVLVVLFIVGWIFHD